MRNRLIVIAGVAALLVALAGGGAYIYFFSGLRTSPTQLGLSSPTPAVSAASASPVSAGMAGTWMVASGSLVGYRVRELFVGQTAKHEAVARTSLVSGGMKITGDATSGFTLADVSITADLTQLHSVDSVAGRDVTQRDGVVSRQLDVSSFPTASFTVGSVTVPATGTSTKISLQLRGNLSVHGVTKAVTATAQAQLNGNKLEVAGSITANMSDFAVSPPQVPFVTVDSSVVIEFDLFLTKSS
jgi:polyisoprenoid-binding protein YceI